MSESERSIRELQETIDELVEKISRYRMRLFGLEESLREQDKKIIALESISRQRDEVIEEMNRSIAVRIGRKCQRVVDKVMPVGTARRRRYERIISGVRHRMDEG